MSIWENIGNWASSEEGQKQMASVLAGLAQRSASKKAKEAGQDILQTEGGIQSEEGKKMYEAMLAELRSGKFDVSQAQRDLSQDTKHMAEEFVETTRQRGQERRGDVVSAIQSGDVRTASMVPKQAQAIEQSIQDAELKSLQTKVGADKAIADLEQSGLDRQARLSEMEMMRGAQGAEAGRQMQLQAMLQQAQAGPQATQEGIQTALAAYSQLFDPEYGDDDKKEDEEEGNAKGGKLDFGREGLKTDGEFSHEDNPKAIIDEDTGIKEGEVTGGELVFNPEQSDNMEELINEDDAEGLLKYLKDLLTKPQFQA
jgi:hypothetical protein